MGDQINQDPASADAQPVNSQESSGQAAPSDTPAAPPTSGDATAATSDSATDGVPGATAAGGGAAPDQVEGNGQTPEHPVHGLLGDLQALMGKVTHFENLGILHRFEAEAKALIERIRAHFG